MPKVKNPLFSQEARGGIGGLVYNTWRGISYVKTNTSPTGQGTKLRLDAQALMGAASKLWAGIGQDNRNLWNTYATDHPVTSWTGAPMRLTGMNWFCRCTVQLMRVGMAYKLSPPALPQPNPLTGLTLSDSAGDLLMAWTTPASGEFQIDTWLIGPISAGISAKIERAKWRRYSLPTDFAGVILESGAAAGRWTVFARSICRNTGLVSTWMSDYADIS
jgi:hypothetical protein